MLKGASVVMLLMVTASVPMFVRCTSFVIGVFTVTLPKYIWESHIGRPTPATTKASGVMKMFLT